MDHWHLPLDIFLELEIVLVELNMFWVFCTLPWTSAGALITPATSRVGLTVSASVITPAQIRQLGLFGRTWSRALVEAGGPVHALAIREAGQVGVPVHTHVHVVAPHT